MFFAELGLRSTIRLTVFCIKFTGQLSVAFGSFRYPSVAFGNYHDPSFAFVYSLLRGRSRESISAPQATPSYPDRSAL